MTFSNAGLLLLGALTLFLVTRSSTKWAPPDSAAPYLAALNDASAQYGLPKNLLARVAYQESHFIPDIINGTRTSSAGAVGLMQIVPVYHPTVNPYDPIASIYYAAKILSGWKNQFGSWPLALAAYNAGPGNVAKYGGVPPFSETQTYVSEISRDVGLA